MIMEMLVIRVHLENKELMDEMVQEDSLAGKGHLVTLAGLVHLEKLDHQ